MGKASSQAKRKWNNANYREFRVPLRKEDDKELIALAEELKESGVTLAEIFRQGLRQYKKGE